MNADDRVRIVGDCQTAMLRAGWAMIESRVLTRGEWLWHVDAIRGEH